MTSLILSYNSWWLGVGVLCSKDQTETILKVEICVFSSEWMNMENKTTSLHHQFLWWVSYLFLFLLIVSMYLLTIGSGAFRFMPRLFSTMWWWFEYQLLVLQMPLRVRLLRDKIIFVITIVEKATEKNSSLNLLKMH